MFTIKDLIDLDLMADAKNLTEVSPQMDRNIEYISVNDLPLDDFIRKNEAVINIATPYVNDPSLMMEFITGLVKAEASIFILAIPDDKITLTEECRNYASENGLAVYQIPWSVRFADIVETVLEKLYHSDLDIFKELQTELLVAFLNNEDINSASDIIARNLSCDTVITHLDGTVIGSGQILEDMSRLSLETDKVTYGYLYFNADLTDKSASMLRHTLSPLLSLWFYREEIIETTQRVAKDDFIWNLANGGNPVSDEAVRTAELMNLQLNISYSCIVGKISLKNKYRPEDEEHWISANITPIQLKILSIAESLSFRIMITHRHNTLIIYFANQFPSVKSKISIFLDAVEDKLCELFGNIRFSWGISEIKDEPANYRSYYLHAKLAEELCSNDLKLSNRYFYENTLIYTMMSTLYGDDEFVEDTYDILVPILDYSKNGSQELIDTLRTYLTTRNVSETAKLLDRHRQTIVYRISKIEELTGMSLKNPDDLFLLETALRLHSGL